MSRVTNFILTANVALPTGFLDALHKQLQAFITELAGRYGSVEVVYEHDPTYAMVSALISPQTKGTHP